MPTISPVILVFGLGALSFGVRWLFAAKRARDIERVFIRDMATNHLPHVYQALEQIATSLGVQLEEPPPIKFISAEEFREHIEGK